MRNKFSLVLPIYNETKNLQKGVLDKILNYAKNNDAILEILVIDDGSTDQSVKTIKTNYIGKFSKLKLIQKEHSGKAYSIIEGIKNSKAPFVFFSDIDLATPIEEADKLITEINKGFDVVIGSRSTDRKDAPFTRKAMAYGFILIRNFFIGLSGIRDTQCGFKAFNKQVALRIIKNLHVFKQAKKIKGSSVGAGFDLEFLYLATKFGYKIKEVPVIWRHVETKNVNFIKDSIETFIDILKIKLNEIKKAYV